MNTDDFNINVVALIIGLSTFTLVSIKIIKSKCCSASECILKTEKNNISSNIDGDV